MTPWRMLAFLNVSLALSGAVVLDRVAVVVGLHVVKTSDIDRDLRATQFLNRESLNFSVDAKKKAAGRLIEQELIRQEIVAGAYKGATATDVDNFLSQLRRDRFGGSAAQLNANLARYGLSEEQLREYLLWQMTVLRFIDERFRAGVVVTDEDVRAYYDRHKAELEKANPQNHTYEALQPKIRDILTGERVNQNFEEWLQETRRRTRVEYREAAFQDGAKGGATAQGGSR
jgi:peptidyl-prolyl cis-trans isomerase SurA